MNPKFTGEIKVLCSEGMCCINWFIYQSFACVSEPGSFTLLSCFFETEMAFNDLASTAVQLYDEWIKYAGETIGNTIQHAEHTLLINLFAKKTAALHF